MNNRAIRGFVFHLSGSIGAAVAAAGVVLGDPVPAAVGAYVAYFSLVAARLVMDE